MFTKNVSWRMLSLGFAAALPLVVVACGDDDDGGENGGNTTAGLSAACEQYFDAIQALSGRCYYGTPLDDDFSPSSREGFVRECARSAIFPGMPPGLAPTISKCASSLAAIDCNAVYGDDDLLCPEFAELRGALAAGEPCEESMQCESGSCSHLNGACGACDRVVSEGESCVEDGVTCARGLLCDRSADGKTGTCGRRKQAGEACRFYGCDGGLVCDGGTCKAIASLPTAGEACVFTCRPGNVCVDAKCVAVSGENEPCLGGNAFTECAPGLRCDEASNTCRRRFTGEVEPGAPCDEDTYCKAGYCEQAVCVAYAKLGEACSDEGSSSAGKAPHCADGFECLAGTCGDEPLACPAAQ